VQSSQTWNIDLASDRFDALRRLIPAVSQSAVTPLPPVAQLLRTVGPRRILAYFEAGDELWLLNISSGTINAQIVGKAAEIRKLAERFTSRPDDVKLADVLGRQLLPASSLPAVASTLYIVPDRVLGTLPFGALRQNGRWIAEMFTVSYLPSVSALGALESIAASPPGPPVVIGDPRGDLPAALDEARWVAARLGAQVVTGSGATRQALSRATGSRVMHIAAHTWLAPGGPWLGLADERLSTSTLLSERIRPQVAVLASCSGAGTRGGGYWGSWAAAFLAVGTPSVVAALWSVGDIDSRDFVVRFYESGGADSPADGVTQAQRASIRAGRPPSFWAPYVHMGLHRRHSN
jgi:hypothetical protein